MHTHTHISTHTVTSLKLQIQTHLYSVISATFWYSDAARLRRWVKNVEDWRKVGHCDEMIMRKFPPTGIRCSDHISMSVYKT